jgi:hypothetical protein
LSKLADATSPDKLKPGQTQFGVFSDLFGARAARTVSAMVQSLDAIKKLREGLDHADGAAERMGAQGLMGLSAASKELAASWNQLNVAIGQSGFDKHMDALMRAASGLLGGLTAGAPAWLKETLGWAASLANALSGSAMQIGILIAMFPKLGAAITTALAPAAALVGRLAGPLAALAYLYEKGTDPEAQRRVEEASKKDHDAVNALLHKLGIGGSEAPAPSTSGGYIGGLSGSAQKLMDSGAQKIVVDVNIPQSIRIQVDANGPNGTRGSSSADLPITAAPRGSHQDGPGAWQRDN